MSPNSRLDSNKEAEEHLALPRGLQRLQRWAVSPRVKALRQNRGADADSNGSNVIRHTDACAEAMAPTSSRGGLFPHSVRTLGVRIGVQVEGGGHRRHPGRVVTSIITGSISLGPTILLSDLSRRTEEQKER